MPPSEHAPPDLGQATPQQARARALHALSTAKLDEADRKDVEARHATAAGDLAAAARLTVESLKLKNDAERLAAEARDAFNEPPTLAL